MAGSMRSPEPGLLVRDSCATWTEWYTANGDVYLSWLRANHHLSSALVLADYPAALAALRKAEDMLFLMSGAIETLRPAADAVNAPSERRNDTLDTASQTPNVGRSLR